MEKITKKYYGLVREYEFDNILLEKESDYKFISKDKNIDDILDRIINYVTNNTRFERKVTENKIIYKATIYYDEEIIEED